MKDYLTPMQCEAHFLKYIDKMRYTHCQHCSESFSLKNTSTHSGWKETQISGVCENCFDNLFSEEAFNGHT